VLNLLLGFVTPQQGQVSINGRDLSRLDLAAWRSRLAWVPQRPRLFHGTVGENICLGLQDVPETAIWEALHQAQAKEFVQRLPQGLQTPIGEGGRQLSGGQAQRLALARAFLRQAELVLLDEPTAHLDLANESSVQAAIDALARDRTLLTVAHRLARVQKADRIVVLQGGRVVEQGDHSQLMALNGLYRRLVEAHGSTA
jgi:ATP-binding cassette subfamily C protein CydD